MLQAAYHKMCFVKLENHFPVLRAEGHFLCRLSGFAHGNAYYLVGSPAGQTVFSLLSFLRAFSVAAHTRNRAICLPSDMQVAK